MTISVFANCVFFLKVKTLSILAKNRLKNCIKQNGGQIAFMLNRECTHVVTDDAGTLSSIHLKAIQKYQLPIVGSDFIWNSVEEGRLLKSDEPLQTLEYITGKENSCGLVTEKDAEITAFCEDNSQIEKDLPEKKDDDCSIDGLRWFSETDKNIPYFPEDFEVAKYDILEKATAQGEYAVVELQCSQQHCDYPFRICVHCSALDEDQVQKQFVPAKSSEKVRRSYILCIEHLKNSGFQLRKDFPCEAEYLASVKLQEMLVAEAIDSSTLSKEVSEFVELIWAEALGHLDHLLAKPITSISLNDVTKAEGILLQAKNALKENQLSEKLTVMMAEFYKIIPHRCGLDDDINMALLSNKHDLCQLIRDMLSIRETNMSVPNPSTLSKFRALRCKIEALDAKSEEFLSVQQQVLKRKTEGWPIKVLKIYKVDRETETASFESHLGDVQSLFHGSSACNFLGIISRGLLPPKIVVEEHGMERSDYGCLGSGIYFSNVLRQSSRYSHPSKTDGTRFLVICDVALGTRWPLFSPDSSLTGPPPGFDSVHGKEGSFFEHDEFVVYRTSQVKMKYVVKFSVPDDKVKKFHPKIQIELDQASPDHQSQLEDYEMPSTNLLKDITPGLLDTSGNSIPLREIHIKGRVIDFVAEVVVFQTYENQSRNPIEAKYVFPLDDTAAVCGFEAFIKEKHIIGEVKEKEKAHREYREAVSRGDGAYLMDQDAPDIFTVSLGNLPPAVKVLIKITYITELSYEKGCLSFHLPAAVAPWQQDKALNENTQDTVRKVAIKQVGTQPGNFSLEMSVEMPFEIMHISSWTHQLKIKKTDCKAVVRTVEDSSLGTSGFTMEILIGDVHLPRMWVEKHPNKESEACMLVFQPEFETAQDPLSTSGETIICLDCSNSMAGSEIQHAKQIAVYALGLFNFTRLRVIKFGTNFIEFPFSPEGYPVEFELVKQFITSATATMGNSDLWKTLRYLNLLYPSKCKRNILLISDGHIQNAGVTLQMVKENTSHTRVFTCGVGPAANRHMLRSLSQYGAGAFEYFDAKSKYNWESKVKRQSTRMYSPACSAVSIKWQQFDTNAPELTYAPAQIQSLFTNERLLIYGFISHCTQATLNALINNQELQTMVSTTELQKTTGTMLHKLAARAFIRDYEQGILHENEAEQEMKKQMLKSMIIRLSLENSIVTQFTSFVAVEKRDVNEDQSADTLNVLELVAKENVDILPYMEYSPTTPEEHKESSFMNADGQSDSIEFPKLASYSLLGKFSRGALRCSRKGLSSPKTTGQHSRFSRWQSTTSFGNKSSFGTVAETPVLYGTSSASGENEINAPILLGESYLENDYEQISIFQDGAPPCLKLSLAKEDIDLQLLGELEQIQSFPKDYSVFDDDVISEFEKVSESEEELQSRAAAEKLDYIVSLEMDDVEKSQEAPEVCRDVQPPCFEPTFPRFPEKYSLMTPESTFQNTSSFGIKNTIDIMPAAGFTFGTASASSQSQISKSFDHNAGLFSAMSAVGIFGTKSTVDTTPTTDFSFGPAFGSLPRQASENIRDNLFGAQPQASIFGTKSTLDTTPAAGFSFSAAFAPAHSQVPVPAVCPPISELHPLFRSLGAPLPPQPSLSRDPGTPAPPPLLLRGTGAPVAPPFPQPGAKILHSVGHPEEMLISDSIRTEAVLHKAKRIYDPTPAWRGIPFGTPDDSALREVPVPAVCPPISELHPLFRSLGAPLPPQPSLSRDPGTPAPPPLLLRGTGAPVAPPFPQPGAKILHSVGHPEEMLISDSIRTEAVLHKAKRITDTTPVTGISFGTPDDSALREVFLKKQKKKKCASITKQHPLIAVSLPQLLQLQHQDGFWQLTAELGTLLHLDVDHLVNVSLAKKGIQSLGPKGKEQLLQLIATILALQVLRFVLGGLAFKSLMKLNDSFQSWPFESIKKAIGWATKTDRQFPAICQRLELGKNWDSATKKLLCIETT